MTDPKVYAVVGWPTLFENAQSRRTERAAWVPIPNKHDGNGYRRIVALSGATDVFTAWILILEVASKMPQRGILYKDGHALDAEDLSIKTGFPAAIFTKAFHELQGKKIQWLSHCALSAIRAHYECEQAEQKGTEQKEQKGMRKEDVDRFSVFWEAYPKKKDKQKALKSYCKNVTEAAAAQVLAAVESQKSCKQWQDYQYIPYPASWLNGRRWEDETDVQAPRSGYDKEQLEAMDSGKI